MQRSTSVVRLPIFEPEGIVIMRKGNEDNWTDDEGSFTMRCYKNRAVLIPITLLVKKLKRMQSKGATHADFSIYTGREVEHGDMGLDLEYELDCSLYFWGIRRKTIQEKVEFKQNKKLDREASGWINKVGAENIWTNKYHNEYLDNQFALIWQLYWDFRRTGL